MAGRPPQRNNISLLTKILSNRESVSPFTLIIDSLEQTSKPLLKVYIARAKASGSSVIYASSSPKCRVKGVIVVNELEKTAQSLQDEIKSKIMRNKRTLIIFESLNALAELNLDILSTFLSSFIAPATNLVAVYHGDVAYPHSRQQALEAPEPLRLLRYIATTLISMHSFSHIVAEKRARDRSVIAPDFGLAEAKEGIIISTSSNSQHSFVIELEHRRRSGRGVREWFFITGHTGVRKGKSQNEDIGEHGQIMLLADHPLIRSEKYLDSEKNSGMATMNTTFNLHLTEKQRSDRDEVNLPYFDAQREQGIGEGGRILYDMGIEDDFDDEEDEI